MEKSELLWVLADYRAANIEAPPRVVSNPELCEADLMTQDEVDKFIKDSIATLRILSDKNSPRYEEMVDNYLADLTALHRCARIDEDELAELSDDAQMHF